MTVAAEANACQSSIRVTVVTEVEAVAVPGAFGIKASKVARMDARVGAANAIAIAVTA
jgi:hypothetical protein